MATKKQKAIIIAMAAMVGTSTDTMRDAAAAALRDMRSDIAHDQIYSAQENPFDLSYTWDPSDGECA